MQIDSPCPHSGPAGLASLPRTAFLAPPGDSGHVMPTPCDMTETFPAITKALRRAGCWRQLVVSHRCSCKALATGTLCERSPVVLDVVRKNHASPNGRVTRVTTVSTQSFYKRKSESDVGLILLRHV